MQDVALRRRVAALVIAALLAISGAVLASAYFAADADQDTSIIRGSDGNDTVRGGGDDDYVAIFGLGGDDILRG